MSMDFGLQEKVIYITGASRGIGLATTKLLLQQGAIVIANARTEESAAFALNQLSLQYPDLLRIKIYDVTNEEALKLAAREVQKEFGYIYGLVNNAGAMYEAAIAMTPAEALQSSWDSNVKSAYLHVQSLCRLMMRQKAGSIINLSSVVARQGAKGQSAYAMSKASLEAFTRSAAKEFGNSNIRVNAVAPGFIETDMTNHYSDEQKQQLLANIPLQRLGNVDDIANTLTFLLSPFSSYITGQVLAVDGALNLP